MVKGDDTVDSETPLEDLSTRSIVFPSVYESGSESVKEFDDPAPRKSTPPPIASEKLGPIIQPPKTNHVPLPSPDENQIVVIAELHINPEPQQLVQKQGGPLTTHSPYKLPCPKTKTVQNGKGARKF